MIKKTISGKRLFVMDTNVLMHDPTALFRFDEHDIFLPMVVLEELDRGKKGLSEVSRNVRQVSRFLDDLMGSCLKPQVNFFSRPLSSNIHYLRIYLDSKLTMLF